MKLNYFNFKPFEDKMLLTNDLGNYIFVSQGEFKHIVQRDVDLSSNVGQELLQKGFVYDDTNLGFYSRLKFDLREVKGYVNLATSLHIFVVTTACNASCIYCQANNGRKHSNLFMNREIAQKAVDIALQSPAHYLSFEFQGGEPLMNFEIIQYIVLYAEEHKGKHEISYNVVTNLTLITDEILEFFQQYRFGISTSVDGAEYVHDHNRPFRAGGGTFQKVVEAIHTVRAAGLHVGAIQTTTRASLPYPKETVSAYRDLGFDSIFVRPLTPLGKATLNWNEIGYTPEEFIEFYTKALEELIHMNQNGYYIRENHASILLSRMSGRFVNYMELRSPCGASVGQLAYYVDGNIFTCDEGRMLYEMGDDTFRLGNVFTSNYHDLINSDACKAVCSSSVLETIPSCCDCVYQPYCGTCPVVNYAGHSDIIEKEPRGYRCKVYSGMLDYLFGKILESDAAVLDVLEAWSN